MASRNVFIDKAEGWSEVFFYFNFSTSFMLLFLHTFSAIGGWSPNIDAGRRALNAKHLQDQYVCTTSKCRTQDLNCTITSIFFPDDDILPLPECPSTTPPASHYPQHQSSPCSTLPRRLIMLISVRATMRGVVVVVSLAFLVSQPSFIRLWLPTNVLCWSLRTSIVCTPRTPRTCTLCRAQRNV